MLVRCLILLYSVVEQNYSSTKATKNEIAP